MRHFKQPIVSVVVTCSLAGAAVALLGQNTSVALLVGAELDSEIERAAVENASEPEHDAASLATLPRDA